VQEAFGGALGASAGAGGREEDAEDEQRQRPRPRPSSTPPPTRSQPPNPRPTSQAPTTTLTQLQIQEQADKLLAQASEIGLSVLSRANAFWKEGKERARGIYEERDGAGAEGERNRSGRGGLMMDRDADGWGTKENAREGAFVDGGERDQRRRKQPSDTRTLRPTMAPQEAVGDLFGDAVPSTTSTTTTSTYVSPFCRTKPTPFWIHTSGVLTFYHGTP
jgi:hypothetical protein